MAKSIVGNKSTIVVADSVVLATEADLANEAVSKGYVDAKQYKHIQTQASASWNIIHNLNKKPTVTVVDSAGTTCIGEIEYNSDNQITIHFSSGFSGTAYLT